MGCRVDLCGPRLLVTHAASLLAVTEYAYLCSRVLYRLLLSRTEKRRRTSVDLGFHLGQYMFDSPDSPVRT